MSMFVGVVLERGEIPEDVYGGPGIAKSLVHRIDELDAMARGLGLRPLGEFVADYEEQIQEILMDEEMEGEDIEEAMGRIGADGPWFDPEEGLRTVRGLMQHLEGPPIPGAIPLDDGVSILLKSLADELGYAQEQRTRFHLAFSE